MAICRNCNREFSPADAEDRFRDHLNYLGWENYIDDMFSTYFDSELCEFCVCDAFNETREEEERIEEEERLWILNHPE